MVGSAFIFSITGAVALSPIFQTDKRRLTCKPIHGCRENNLLLLGPLSLHIV